ncbi:MAG: hypothetical protein O7D30_11515 [Rickettsia endosymbiont of Ixodes persulcatus]|nr:hypothetical protein [Rickettsia endosymbiont of Ixodes persulcatus]
MFDLGVDISIECAGSVITQEQCLLVTKKGGLIGYQEQKQEEQQGDQYQEKQ